MIKLSEIVRDSLVDGEGLRCAVFVAGCNHACEGCHNPHLWNPANSKDYTYAELTEELTKCMHDMCDGITLTGGDPCFDKNNTMKIIRVIRSIKQDTNIWMYTGNLIDKVPYELLMSVDVIVDGKYEKDKPKGLYSGSDNQYIWRKVSCENGKICFENQEGFKKFFEYR